MIARKAELAELDKVMSKDEPEFIAVYGRRRIGKTFLIHNYFKNKAIYFEIFGKKGATAATHLMHFAESYAEAFSVEINAPKSWHEAFSQLNKKIESLPKNQKIVLFFDELPWLATQKSDLLETIDYFWNRHFSRRPNLILVVCGSAATWMIKNIVNNKGGLHNRITRILHMRRFTLKESQEYLISKGIDWPKLSIIESYMVFGGVAKYLSYLDKGLSPAQNIQKICFGTNAPLHGELNNLYSSLFDHSEQHESIVDQLAQHFYGLNQTNLSKLCKIPTGGQFTKILGELVASDFVVSFQVDPKSARRNLNYRLIDPFTFFAQKWINQNSKLNKDYFLKARSEASWNSWKGLAFEMVCLNHVSEILTDLGIDGVQSQVYSWRNKQQVDLIIDRADRTINLVEIKYRESPLVLTSADQENLIKKKYDFVDFYKTKKAIIKTLVTNDAPSESARIHFDNIVNVSEFF